MSAEDELPGSFLWALAMFRKDVDQINCIVRRLVRDDSGKVVSWRWLAEDLEGTVAVHVDGGPFEHFSWEDIDSTEWEVY